jgi:hypothetical protein
MEELIEIIIALIGKMMAGPKPPPRQAQPGRPPMLPSTPQTPSGHGGAAYKPIPGARALPPSRAAVKTKAPPARRRRVAQPPPMIAAPIVTRQRDEPLAPPLKPSQASRVKPIAETQTKKPSAALDAAAFRRWLTPATLRQQFLLTEIFQPPLALRAPPQHLAAAPQPMDVPQ